MGLYRITVYFDRWSRSDTASSDPKGYRGVVIRDICAVLAAGRSVDIWFASSEQGLGGVFRLDAVASFTLFERDEDGKSVPLPSLSTSQVERYISGLLAKAEGAPPPTKCLQVSWVDSALVELGSSLVDVPGIDSCHVGLGLYALRLLRIRALEDKKEVGTVCG